MNQPNSPLDSGASDDDEWTIAERVQVLWDRSSVRWIVTLLVCALVFALVVAMRSTPESQPTASSITTVGSPAPGASGSAAPRAPSSSPGSASATEVGFAASNSSGVSGAQVVDAEAAIVIVDVVGPVRQPGVVTLPQGSRVADAIAAAGGLARGKTKINLARVLVDGEQIDVAAPATQTAIGSQPESASSGAITPSSSGGLVNINTATPAQLEELPRIGPVTAAKIIDFRDQYGGFRTIEQLKEVPGVGDVTFSGLAPLITL